MRELERITGVALLVEGGKVMLSLPAPNRHHHIIHACAECKVPQDVVCDADQGFYTSTGRYVTREEGLFIAESAGQITEKGDPQHMLFSEDLW